MPRSAQNYKKCTFLDKLRTVTQEENMATRQITPFFSSAFSVPTVCNIHYCIFCIWSVKYLSFGQKLLIWAAHHTFLERRHPEVTKNPHHVLSPQGIPKGVLAHGLEFQSMLNHCVLSDLLNFRNFA